MAVYELLMRSMEERNAEHYIEALHDDYEFVRHQSGTTMDKDCLLYTSPSPRDS